MKKLFTLYIALVIASNVSGQEIVKAETVTLNGKGDPLLLLHGWGQSSKYWLPYLLDFYEDFEVYLFGQGGVQIDHD